MPLTATSDEISLLQHLFGASSIEEATEEQLAEMIGQYPYFAHPRWFKALKPNDNSAETDDAKQAAAVFTSRPLRLMQFLTRQHQSVTEPSATLQETDEPIPVNPESPPEKTPARQTAGRDNGLPAPDAPLAPPLIQPLFTRDYFAFTGQKLPEHIDNDKRPTMDQLHSFTGWLRTLKRNRSTTDPDLQQDEASMAARSEIEDAGIRKHADQSVQPAEDVVTEAMAEVRVSNGQTAKAIEIYEKLSLSNPEKSAYFAQKIDDLKNN